MYRGERLLTIATKYENEEMVKMLLGMRRIGPDYKDLEGATPLWLAAKGRCFEIASHFLETKRVDPNYVHEDCTPLITAVKENDERIVRFLLRSARLDVNWKDLAGDIVLHIAIRCVSPCLPDPTIVKLLLERADTRWNLPNRSGVIPFDLVMRLFQGSDSDTYLAALAVFFQKDATAPPDNVRGLFCRFCSVL